MNEAALFALLYSTYFLSYISRKNIIFIAPHLAQFGFTKSDLGASQSSFTACYLISKLSSNLICNWASPRLVLSIGITAVGFINILAGVLEAPEYMWALWGLNGLCSGACWPPIGNLIVSHFPQHKRGKIWSLISSSMNAGSTVCPPLTHFLVYHTSWNASFTIIGTVDVIIGAVLFAALPENKGTDNCTETSSSTSEKVIPWKWDMVLNRFMFAICFSFMILTFSLIAMSTWGQMLFMEKLNTDTLTAGFIVSLFEVGGFCGATASGFLADLVARNFKTKGSPRSYSGVLCSGIFCISITTLQCLPPSTLLCKTCAIGCGFGLYGTMAIYGLLTREYVSKEHSGTLNAVMCVCSQVGGFFAGSPLARFYETHAVSDGFWIVAYVAPVAFVCVCVLTIVDGKYKKKDD